MRRSTSAGRSGTVRSAVAARLGASGPTPRASVSPIPALLRPGARPPCWGLVACRRSSFFRLLVFSRLFLPVPRSSSSANRFPVRVVIRSCGAHVLHRAAPTPKVSSWISTPGDGRRLRFGVVCVVTLRQPPQATGDQAWDECSRRGDDRRSDAGPRRSRCSRCRGHACGRRARRPTDGGGTAPQVPAQVRVGDDTRFTASGPIRLAVHRSQPVLPSAASTRCLAAVARKSASDRVQIAVTASEIPSFCHMKSIRRNPS